MDLIVFAEILSFLLGMLKTKLFRDTLLCNNHTIDVVFMLGQVIYGGLGAKEGIPSIVKFLISCFTSGEKYLRHVGQVRMLDVRKSMRQLWQKVWPHWRILGILSLSLNVSKQMGQVMSISLSLASKGTSLNI
jgi:hypothetical protein